MTLSQFLTLLDESGIITAEEAIAFQKSQGAACNSALELAKILVEQGKLTEFQIKMILQCKGDRLFLGDYVILQQIGAGGMGKVYLAEHCRMKRQVALKSLPLRMVPDEQAIGRFHREVQAAAKLTHPNIVTAYDAGEDKEIHYFVMEYVEGINLSEYVKEEGVLPVEVAVDYITQVAKGLGFAHSKNIVHRDIKPANLLLDNNGVVKILDMGLARVDSEGTDDVSCTMLTESGNVMGTADYMAPEQAKNTHTADTRADIYSLGCSLYFLLTGKVMYQADSFINKVVAHLEEPIPSLIEACPEASKELDSLFQKMVSKFPEGRYQTIEELLTALEALPIGQEGSGEKSDRKSLSQSSKLRKSRSREDLTTIFSEYGEEDYYTKYFNPSASATVEIPKTRYQMMIWGMPLMGLALLWWALSNSGTVSVSDETVPRAPVLDQPVNIEAVNADRNAAICVLELGGTVEIIVDGQPQEIQKLSEIPTKTFEIQNIILHDNPRVQDDDLKRFSSLERMEKLDLYGTNISDEGIKHLKDLPALLSIDLFETTVSNPSLKHLGQFPTLQSLSVQNTTVSNQGLEYLKGLSSLNSLNLANTRIDDAGLAYLKGLTGLQWLQMSFTNVSDVGLMELSDLKSLRELYVQDTQITVDGINLLLQAIPECKIEQ